jgi:hypothetical protein
MLKHIQHDKSLLKKSRLLMSGSGVEGESDHEKNYRHKPKKPVAP